MRSSNERTVLIQKFGSSACRSLASNLEVLNLNFKNQAAEMLEELVEEKELYES